ncbi:hypothetical protein CGRA01v4_03996 [Colletotrichum graminicola]|uniref:Uncharacterized protein n=1 Tax=Colletotrichum graminicola (strain M1.001 / M2 / FGSC 10212) TaxID=645133 RepID=E3QZ62_COLGM|nr:uncharacterized protein GLRG_11294 [Colletotrichum graminicola M1.001]EFQ36150.1 hypothetical protein GLRG_11294 [Colletotrichum graminicola M1.001]WDK12716.1 hypothetical protein CGRA01v4_03996 [Colletotrichum graminicola]
MAILKPTTRPVSSTRVERTPEEKKGPLKPSGGGIKKTSTKASSNSALRPINHRVSAPIFGPSARSNTGSSSGSSTTLSTTTKTSQTAARATKQPYPMLKTSIFMRRARHTKKLVKVGTIPGMMPISSFGSIAAQMRATLKETQLREKESSESSQAAQ